MLNCEICAQTQHHCCKASITFNVMEVIDLVQKANELHIDVKIRPSKEKPNSYNLVRKDKVVKSLNDENCIFLKNGRCSIYNERPSICRVYGTKLVKCWFHDFDYDTPANTLFELTDDKVKELTNNAITKNEKSVIEFFQSKMK
jgi:Fe-S-cluster containining protein